GDGDEPAAASGAGEFPVVVAEAHRQVTQPAGGEAPLFVQDVRQLPLINVAGLLLHGLSVRITSVRITVEVSRGDPADAGQDGADRGGSTAAWWPGRRGAGPGRPERVLRHLASAAWPSLPPPRPPAAGR